MSSFELRTSSERVVFATRDDATLHHWVELIRTAVRDAKMAIFARTLQQDAPPQ